MLVLTRKLNEQIRIGDDVTITVLRVKGNTIRLGIEAPRSTRVVRGELKPLDQLENADGHADAASGASERNAAATSAGESNDEAPVVLPMAEQRSQSRSPLAAYMPHRVTAVAADLSV